MTDMGDIITIINNLLDALESQRKTAENLSERLDIANRRIDALEATNKTE